MSKPDIVAMMTEEARSYSNLCAVLDHLAQGNRGETRLQPQRLQSLIQAHCEQFVKAYLRRSAGHSDISYDDAPPQDVEKIADSGGMFYTRKEAQAREKTR